MTKSRKLLAWLLSRTHRTATAARMTNKDVDFYVCSSSLPTNRPPTKKQELNDEDSVYDSIDPESKAPNEDDGYMQPVQVDLSLSCSFTKHEKIDKKTIDDMEDGYLKPSLFSDPPLKRAPEPPGAVGRVRDDAVGTVAVKRPAQKDGDEDDAWEEDYISTIAYVNINLTARTSRVPPVDSSASLARIEEEEEDPERKYDRISAGASIARKWGHVTVKIDRPTHLTILFFFLRQMFLVRTDRLGDFKETHAHLFVCLFEVFFHLSRGSYNLIFAPK